MNANRVISRYREISSSLRSLLGRILHRAGVPAWPKMFQNLRASRATELANEYPAHAAAAWLGHSVIVSSKHHWQVTDGDFEAAARGNVAASNDASK